MVSRKSEVEVGCRKHEDARLNAAVGDEGQLTIPLTPTLPLPLTVTLAPNLAPTLALTLTLTLTLAVTRTLIRTLPRYALRAKATGFESPNGCQAAPATLPLTLSLP